MSKHKQATWVDGHDRLRVSEQYAGRPGEGINFYVEQRTTLAGRPVLLTLPQVAELYSWLGERLAEGGISHDGDGPVLIVMNTDPPKPPYGTPERAAWDAGERP